jgi:hypothetical protein
MVRMMSKKLVEPDNIVERRAKYIFFMAGCPGEPGYGNETWKEVDNDIKDVFRHNAIEQLKVVRAIPRDYLDVW